MQILITIIGEQTAPNYLFLKQHQDNFDFFLFISTSEMEEKEKSKQIVRTAKIKEDAVRIIKIEQNELYATKKKIAQQFPLNKTDNYWVNITGGTKLMSNAVYDLFKDYNCRYFYVPIGQNIYTEIYRDKPALSKKVTYELTVAEYLNIYGVDYENSPLYFTKENALMLMQEYLSKSELKNQFSKVVAQKAFKTHKQIVHQWFEEYCYRLIGEAFSLNEGQIVTGIELFKMAEDQDFTSVPNDNEIDVAFIYKNNFYMVEAKYSLGKAKINAPSLNQYIYKLAAINKRFGLRARATLFTLADLTQLSFIQQMNLQNRCSITSIYPPLHSYMITDKKIFKQTFRKFLK